MRLGAPAAAAAVVVLAGCGGSSGGGAKGGGAGWAAKADAICARTEARIRGREPAKSSRDLERLMAPVIEDLQAGRTQLRELEVPEDQRAKAKPFLREVDRVVQTAERIRDTAREPRQVTEIGRNIRVQAIDLDDSARPLGLKRCGGGSADAASDAVLMPGYAGAVVESLGAVLPALDYAGELGRRDGSPEQQFEYWRQILRVADVIKVPLDTPQSLRDEEGHYVEPLGRTVPQLEAILGHLNGDPKLPAKKLREDIRAVDKGMAATRRNGYALLKATGAPGDVLLPRVRAAIEGDR